MPTLPPLPHATLGRLMGLLEAMERTPKSDSLSELAQALHLELDDLLPLAQATQLLGFAVVREGRYDLTEGGRRAALGDERERKALFRQGAQQAPLLRLIVEALAEAGREPVPREKILKRLGRRFPKAEAQRQLDTAVNWGRYSDLFDYDAETACFTGV